MSKTKVDYKEMGYRLAHKQLGRPLKGDAPLEESVTFRLTKNEASCLQDYCFRYDLKPSEVIRWCLDVLSVTGL
jgi:hypothetical protein